MIALVTIEAVLIALLAVLVVGLLRSHAEIISKLHDLGAGLESGDSAHAQVVPPPQRIGRQDPIRADGKPGREVEIPLDISGVTLNGDAQVVSVAGSSHRTLLAFLSSGCATCGGFWKAFRTEGGALGGSVVPGLGSARLVVVTRDPAEESPTALGNLAPPNATIVMSTKAWSDYGVPGSPYFVFVDGPSSSIAGEGTAATWDQLQRLVAQSFADEGHSPRGSDVAGRLLRRVPPQPESLSGPEREERNDLELAKAGILPGDPSLYAKDIGQVFPGE